jgi:hypothetical protein
LKIKYIVLGVISVSIVVGMLLKIFNLLGTNAYFSAALLLIGLISFVGYISMIMKKLFPEFKHGLPSDDERSKKVKYYSAGRAYFFSLYIWIALLAFQKYLDRDDTLIFGILGMVLSLFASWLITKNKKGFD